MAVFVVFSDKLVNYCVEMASCTVDINNIWFDMSRSCNLCNTYCDVPCLNIVLHIKTVFQTCSHTHTLQILHSIMDVINGRLCKGFLSRY